MCGKFAVKFGKLVGRIWKVCCGKLRSSYVGYTTECISEYNSILGVDICFGSGLFIPRPPVSSISRTRTATAAVRRHSKPEDHSEPEDPSEPEERVSESEPEERVSEKRIKKHLAGRYNVKAKWEKLLTEKKARVSRLETP